MHEFLQRLILDHKRLAVLLNILEHQLDDFHAGNEHDLDLVCELVQYIKSYEDQVHHPTEDLIFTHFKALTNHKRVAVETLEEQHQILAGMSKRFHNTLDAVMHGDVVPRHEVEAQGRAIIRILRDHVKLEEHEVFSYINEQLGPEDWAALELKIPKIGDPVFEQPDAARFRALLRHLAQAQISLSISDTNTPIPLRVQ